MRRLLALGDGVQINQNAPVLDFHRIGRNAILFEAGFADPCATMEFPIVPWTDNVLSVQPAVAKRPADMVAGVGNHPDFSLLERDGKFRVGGFDTAQRPIGSFLQRADIKPILVASHRSVTLFFGLAPRCHRNL
ncbi:MAG: hypothetical protein U1E20_11135 [Methylocystis sp.]